MASVVIVFVACGKSLYKSYQKKKVKSKKEKDLFADPTAAARAQRAAARRERQLRQTQRRMESAAAAAAARRAGRGASESRFSTDTLRGMMAGDAVIGRRRFSDESTVVVVPVS